jgi:tight adherence protein C
MAGTRETESDRRGSAVYKLMQICGLLYSSLRIKNDQKTLEKYREKAALAGLGKQIQPESILGAKYLLAVAGIVTGLILATNSRDSLIAVVLLTGMSVMGFTLPDIILRDRILKKKWRIETELPYVLNTLSIMTEAGASLTEAMRRICIMKEGILINELKLVNDELEIGILQKEALLNMSGRCQVNEVTRFVFALVQSIEKGSTGISDILKEQALEDWQKRKNKAKELGEKASMKLFLPMLLLVFPCLLIFLAGPAVMSIMKLL